MTTLRITSAADFATRLKKLIPFMSTEETRYYICGVYFEYADNTLKLTAANGHILCNMQIEALQSLDGEAINVICPAHAVKAIAKLVSTKDKKAAMLLRLSKTKIVFEFDDFSYHVTPVDGTYPDYTKVFPDGKKSLGKGVNATYLKTVLATLGNRPVDITTQSDTDGATQPHLFSADGDVKCVIMPIRC